MLMQGQSASNFDLELLLPLETIRAHTKTMDIITVTDAQLKTYRESAFEAAEQYTGLYLRGLKWVTEQVPLNKRHKTTVIFKTKYPVSDGYVHVTGNLFNHGRIFIGAGNRTVEIQLLQWGNGVFNECCNPCANPAGDLVMYQTGYSCAANVPYGVVVGALKYIAFNMSNAGDISYTQVNERPASGIRFVSNDAVVASGAVAEWHRYRVIV